MKLSPRVTVTLPDGSTFQKEFLHWITPTSSTSKSVKGKAIPRKSEPRPQHNVYYDSLKPIFVVLTLTGVLPVFRLKVGSNKVQILLGSGICLISYIFFAHFTYLVTLDVLHRIFHDDDFGSIIVQVTLMMFLSQHVFYVLLTWPESVAVNRYLIQWREFQTQYELVTHNKLQLIHHVRLSMWLIVSASLSGVCTFITDQMDDNIIRGSVDFVVIFYQFFVQLCFYLVWLSNSWAVIEAARQYYNHLARECASDIPPERLEDYRLLWMRLTELVRSGSSMLSYTMAVIITSSFIFEVIASYNLTMYAIRRIQGGPAHSQEALATGIGFLFYGFLLYMFCDSGHCMTTECEKIEDVLLRYTPKSPSTALPKVNTVNAPITWDARLVTHSKDSSTLQCYESAAHKEKLRLFLRSLRSAPPLATLSGYVTINRKVFLHLSGVLVTYLIILVQFNISSVHSDTGKGSKTKQLQN